MERHTTTSRAEAERLLGIAEKLLRSKDYSGCRDFAILAQETEPLLEGSDQILAVAEVLHAADTKKLKANQNEWYAILQIAQRTDEHEVIKKQYRRLALMLHPDKNKFPYADHAFRLVADAWAVLSDSGKKSSYDREFAARFAKVDLVASKKQQSQQARQQKKQPPASSQGAEASGQKLPVRRSGRDSGGSAGGAAARASANSARRSSGGNNPGSVGNFWTACPYCYNLYEYPRPYEGCCLRCDSSTCKRAFTATEVRSLPPQVPGKDAYYCCWGFFPMGFVDGGSVGKTKFPKWMPPLFDGSATAAPPPPPKPRRQTQPEPEPEHEPQPPPPPPPQPVNAIPVSATPVNPRPVAAFDGASSEKRKRGRPKKYFN